LTTQDFIVQLFCRIDDALADVPKHPRASLHPSEIVTLAVLFALKGKGGRAFHRWIKRDFLDLFPYLPERTRLLRLFAAHQDWAERFLAEPTLLGICDSFGIELIHPRREGRSEAQIGRKGKSNGRWIVGVKWCPLINSRGQIVDWDADSANVHDTTFHRMLKDYENKSGVYVDGGFHKSHKRGGDPLNLKVCKRGENNLRMLVETLFSQMTGTFCLKKIGQRSWAYVEARLAFAAAAYNLLISWGGQLSTDETGCVRLGIAEFSL
jgi:hypothetical protein